jgi:hypothetical protein
VLQSRGLRHPPLRSARPRLAGVGLPAAVAERAAGAAPVEVVTVARVAVPEELHAAAPAQVVALAPMRVAAPATVAAPVKAEASAPMKVVVPPVKAAASVPEEARASVRVSAELPPALA